MSTSLVFLSKESIPLTTSEIIASTLERSHKVTIELIRNHLDALSNFGRVPFQTAHIKQMPNGGTAASGQIAYLNEQQAMLLITFMTNTPKVVRFKVALVKAFYEMRQALAAQSHSYSADEIALVRDKALRQGMAIAYSKMKAEAPKEGAAISKKSIETAYKMLKSHADNRREFCMAATKMNEMIKDIEYVSRVLWYYSDFLAYSAPSALDELAQAFQSGHEKLA